MNKSKWLYLGSSIVLFLILLSLAVYYESIWFLYAASALPVLIVLLLPDFERYQYIHASKSGPVRFTKHGDGEDTTLSIAFKPGYVQWKRHKLFFRVDGINESAAVEAAPSSERNDTSLPVLPFDLSVHPRKQGWVGVDLAQLAERTRGMSYTTSEVTRLIIRVTDLEKAALQMTGTANSAAVSAPNNNKTMQA